MTTALMVSDSFARRMAEARAEFRRGVPIESIRSERPLRIAASAAADSEKSLKEKGYYTIAGAGGLGGSMAVVPIAGPIWAEESFWSRIFGGVTVAGMSRAFRVAAEDKSVSRVLLDIDSPGGAAQMQEAIASLVALRTAKPVHAVACVDACSAAYWIACHADEVIAKPDSLIGSVGTRLSGVFLDFSAYLEEEGIRAHGVSTGIHKLTGEFGLPISDEQLAQLRGICESLFDLFGGDVSERRGIAMETLREMEGGLYVGAEAVKRGLADRVVESMDTLVRELAGMAPGVRAERKRAEPLETPDEPNPDAPDPDDPIAQEHRMSKNGTGAAPDTAAGKTGNEAGTSGSTALESAATKGPASFADLKALATRAKLPAEAHAAFIVECQDKGLTIEAATDAAFARMGELLSQANTTAQDATKKADLAAKNAAAVGTEGDGVRAPSASVAGAGDAKDALGIAACKSYDEAVSQLMIGKGMSRTDAVKALNADPIGKKLREPLVARR